MPVAAVEPIVSLWRERFDSSAPRGMPAHVTLLAPFLPEVRLDAATLAELGAACAGTPAATVTFRRTARFPRVLYLAPEPDAGLRALTLTLAERWPEAPPYAGAFEDVVPHLTVARSVADAVMDEIERRLQPTLPLQATLRHACLYVFDGERWAPRARLPFDQLPRH